jgi:hypothetical protein
VAVAAAVGRSDGAEPARQLSTNWSTIPLFGHFRMGNFTAADLALMDTSLQSVTVQGTLYGGLSGEQQAQHMRDALTLPVLIYRNLYGLHTRVHSRAPLRVGSSVVAVPMTLHSPCTLHCPPPTGVLPRSLAECIRSHETCAVTVEEPAPYTHGYSLHLPTRLDLCKSLTVAHSRTVTYVHHMQVLRRALGRILATSAEQSSVAAPRCRWQAPQPRVQIRLQHDNPRSPAVLHRRCCQPLGQGLGRWRVRRLWLRGPPGMAPCQRAAVVCSGAALGGGSVAGCAQSTGRPLHPELPVLAA